MEQETSSGTVNPWNGFRLNPEDNFRFNCGPHVPCFTECCGKLELLLTPYDVFRMRTALGISSGDFLDQYTVMRHRTAHGFPEIMMKMDMTTDKRCPFVTTTGCSIYKDRPGACRIYPLGRASTSTKVGGAHKEFYFVVKEDHCKGFEQVQDWSVAEWLEDQGMVEYNRINDLLMELYVRKARLRTINLTPQHIKMFVMACYNIEKFREFIFRSPFLVKFDLAPDLVDTLKTSDLSLLEFAFVWLRFALFGEPVIKVRS